MHIRVGALDDHGKLVEAREADNDPTAPGVATPLRKALPADEGQHAAAVHMVEVIRHNFRSGRSA